MNREGKFSKESYDTFEKISEIADGNMKKLKKIAEGDDWSFIIKIMALVESALNRLLTSQTKDEKFEKLFSKLAISVKLNMAYELDFFTSKKEKIFIEYIVALRNKLAHNPNEMDFQFKEYFNNMDKTELNDFKNHMNIDDKKKDKEYYDFIFNHPKDGILILTNSILSVFAFMQEFNKLDKKNEQKSFKIEQSLLSQIVDNAVSSNISKR